MMSLVRRLVCLVRGGDTDAGKRSNEEVAESAIRDAIDSEMRDGKSFGEAFVTVRDRVLELDDQSECHEKP